MKIYKNIIKKIYKINKKHPLIMKISLMQEENHKQIILLLPHKKSNL
jgi:hypothetical protein